MNKHTSFALVILTFLFLSILVFLGFFVISPEVKAYRTQAIALEQQQEVMTQKVVTYNKAYETLQSLQERENVFDQALKRHFQLERFEAYLKQYFLSYEITSITTEQNEDLQIDTLEVRAIFDAPVRYYHFIDALNAFTWVAKLEGIQEFKGVAVGIEAHFALKVYTQLD